MSRPKKSKRKAPKRARTTLTPIGSSLVPESALPPTSLPSTDQFGSTLVPELPQKSRSLAEILEEKRVKLKENRDAMRPLLDLRRDGITDEIFLVWLLADIWMALQPPSVDKLESIPGLTFEAIDNIPVCALELAANMKRLHEHGFYAFGPWRVREEKKLTNDLLEIAEHLSEKTNKVKRRKQPGTKGMEPGSMEKLRLIWYIKHTTGKPHYSDLASLINTFNRLEDRRYDCTTVGGEVTVNSLTLLWARYESLPELADTPTKLPLARLSPIN